MACMELRTIIQPATQFMHDPMHCLFVGGVFNVVVYTLLEALFQGGTRGIYKALQTFLDGWRWPKSAGWDQALKDVLSAERIKSSRTAKTFKCSGSEALALYPVIAYFVLIMDFATDFPNLSSAYLAFAALADTMQEVAYGGVSEARLRTACESFENAFVAAGLIDFFVPKFHWLVHFPRHLRRHGWIPSCWVLERKHKDAKRYAGMAHNMTSYARSLLCDALCHNINVCTAPGAFQLSTNLLNARRASRRSTEFVMRLFGFSPTDIDADDVHTAPSARYGVRGTVHVSDVILVRNTESRSFAGRVSLIAAIRGEPFIVISAWDFIDADNVHRRWSRWTTHDDNFHAAPLEDVMCTCTHKLYDDGRAVVLEPFHTR